jgi:hypothetical protein
MVTRWLKRAFSPEKEQRPIPPVTLPSLKQRYVERADALILTEKMTKGLPKEYGNPVADPLQSIDEIAKNSLQRHSDVRKRRLLTTAYKEDDFEKVRLLDKYMEQYDPHTVSGTIDRLRKEGVTNVNEWITPERMNAVDDFFREVSIADEMVRSTDEKPRYDPHYAHQVELLARHVTMHPEDGPALGTIMQRGVRDADTAMKALEEFKSSGIPTSLNDGFL